MKHIKNTALVLVMALILPLIAITANAADAYGFAVKVSPQAVRPGGQAEVTVALTGYTAEAAAADGIRGLQVDITGIDTTKLTVVEKSTLIVDNSGPMSNTASYNASNKRVRLAYIHRSGSLPAPCEDVLKVVFQLDSALTGTGSITLPVTVKIQTFSRQITQTGEIIINYSDEIVPVINVDITWGNMQFEYSDGTWNTRTYSYDNPGWTDNGTGYVTAVNTGEAAATVQFVYNTDRTDISGSFTDGTSAIDEKVTINAGAQTTANLVLSGKPSEILDNTTIGTVTVTIGGE